VCSKPGTQPAVGKVYLAVVLDAFSRRVVGWSIADHIRSELVVDAVPMAIWRGSTRFPRLGAVRLVRPLRVAGCSGRGS
jgi:transposase InsO family protein